MKRLTIIFSSALIVLLFSQVAAADTHLELGLDVSPTMIQDPAFEAFSTEDMRSLRFGGDLRLEVASFWRNVRLLPVIGYRASLDEGDPYYVLDTGLTTHDFFAGLRFRGWFKQWFGIYLQATGGVLWARMDGTIAVEGGVGARTGYRDDMVTWSAGGLAGLEFRLSPALLARRGVTKFNFGGEIGAGYVRRGNMKVDPDMEGGDDHSLPMEQTRSWGDINLSGWVVQIGLTLSFF